MRPSSPEGRAVQPLPMAARSAPPTEWVATGLFRFMRGSYENAMRFSRLLLLGALTPWCGFLGLYGTFHSPLFLSFSGILAFSAFAITVLPPAAVTLLVKCGTLPTRRESCWYEEAVGARDCGNFQRAARLYERLAHSLAFATLTIGAQAERDAWLIAASCYLDCDATLPAEHCVRHAVDAMLARDNAALAEETEQIGAATLGRSRHRV
ncbi:MAG: hypothetical protein HYV02_00480 [Deltaproteobacteria bacterium]|nr:hypothetical protein [Deltaproteobacteria bacterium]